MPASVTAEYSQNFLIGEEHLTKIDELIRSRSADIPDFSLQYQVHRLDHALITYDTPAEVTAEQNNLVEGIESLRIFGRTPEADEMQFVDLRFSKKRGVELNTYFHERDRALLLAADLKTYITTEILRSRLTRVMRFVESREFLLLCFSVGFFVSLLVVYFSIPNVPKLDNAHATDSERLQYLVKVSNTRSDSYFMFPVLTAPLFFFALSFGIRPLARIIFLPSTFYLGKEIGRHNRRVAIRNQVFWVVVVGFIISIIASFAVSEFSKP